MTGSGDATTPLPQAADRLGGRFLLRRRLSQGGMGTVHEAHDTALDRPVAIKVLHQPHDPTARERFRREAQAVAALDHPSIVAIYDYGVDGPWHYLVLELVDGRDLATVLADEGQFSPARAVETTVQVCEALTHAHAAGIVHRDINPRNILLRPDGQVSVTDFGIAQMADHTSVTAAGSMIGTARYCAPEQVAGEEVGPPADLYAVGLVLYELLTGQPAFDGEHPAAIAARRLSEPVPPPSQLRPDLPAALDQVVARSTARDPRDRFPTAEALGQALLDVLDDTQQTTLTLTAPLRQTWRTRGARHRRRLPHAAAAAVLAVAALTAVSLQNQSPSEQPAATSTAAPPAAPAESASTPPHPTSSPAPAPPSRQEFRIAPGIVGLEATKVADRLRQHDFQVQLQPRPADQPAGVVVAVDPPVGSHVQPGDTITLHVAARR